MYLCLVKNRFNIWLSYLLTFSLIGIVLIQVFFIRKEKQLLEQHISLSAREALAEVDRKIQEQEIKNVMENPNFEFAEKLNKIHSITKRQQDSIRRIYKELLEKRYYKGVNQMLSTDWTDSIWNKSYQIIEQQLASLQEKTLYLYLLSTLSAIPVQRRVDTTNLRRWIEEAMQKRHINTPFEYAILDNGYLTTVHSKGFVPNEQKRLYIHYPILQSEQNSSQYLLVLSLPKKQVYSRTIYYVAALGGLFILILIAVYFYTVYQLIRQKYLARMKTDFINNITHEFKTPIATMNLIIDTLRNPSVLNNPEMVKNYLKKLKDENKRMLDQVEKILMLGRIEQNRMVWNDEPVSLNEIIEEAIEQMSLILEDHNGKIYFETSAEKDIVYGDPVMLQRVFINLIDNAIKYSTKNPVIQIRTYNRGKFVVVEFKDNGIGMSKTVQKHVFDKFFRKPTGDVHNVKGHGIGLTLVKQVLDHVKAHVYIESEEGKGTTFYLYFPLTENNDQLETK